MDGLVNETCSYRRFALLLATVWTVAILLPLVLADRPWNDDLVRASTGAYGWSHNGRHLTQALMRLLSLGSSRTFDLAPLPQLLSIAFLVTTAVGLLRRFELPRNAWILLCLFPLAGHPFWLENLAFQFDSAGMALALLLASTPILIRAADWRACVLGGLALLASLYCYQPAISWFLVWMSLESLLALMRGAPTLEIIQRWLIRAAQVLVALLVYRWLVRESLQDWVASRSEGLNPVTQSELIGQNLIHAFAFVWNAFAPKAQVLILVLIAVAATLILHAVIRDARRLQASDRLKRLSIWAVITLSVPPAAIGPMLMLSDPPWMARVLPGIGAAVSAMLILAHEASLASRLRKNLLLPVVCGFALIGTAYAFALGNAAKAQYHFEQQVAAILAQDLSKHPGIQTLNIDGTIGHAPIAQHTIIQLPLLGRVIQPYVSHGDLFTRQFLYAELSPFWQTDWNAQTIGDGADQPWPDDARLLESRGIYRLYQSENAALLCLPFEAEVCPAPDLTIRKVR